MSATFTASPTFRRALNDNLSNYLCDMVPGHLDTTDRFLDVLNWNLRYFNHRDPERVEVFTRVLQEINADLMVFQEVEAGALDEVAHNLVRSGAGLYAAEYGSTGGRNRVAFLIDTEWVRNTTDIGELFAGEWIVTPDTGRVVFPRLPLAGEFIVRSKAGSFNLDIVGLHMRSCRASAQGGGGPERRAIAARRLAQWLHHESSGEDAIVTGDWNSLPGEPEWAPLQAMADEGKVHLRAWNPKGELSHLLHRRSKRIDTVVVSPCGNKQPTVIEEAGHRSTIMGWENEILSPTLLNKIQEKVSNEMPVLCRFVFAK